MSVGREESLPEVEAEIERTRADLDETLDRLKDKLDPAAHVRHAADELADGVAPLYGHEPGSDDARREVRRLLADNLLPLALIAGGLTWIVVNEIRRSRRLAELRAHGPYPSASYESGAAFDEGPGPAPTPRGPVAGVADDPLAEDPLKSPLSGVATPPPR